MSVASKRVVSLKEGNEFTAWTKAGMFYTLCSTSRGTAIQMRIDSGNVQKRYAESVRAVQAETQTWTEWETVFTVAYGTMDSLQRIRVTNIDNALFLVLQVYDASADCMRCDCYRDDTGLGGGFAKISTVRAICTVVGNHGNTVGSPPLTSIIKLSNGVLAMLVSVNSSTDTVSKWKRYLYLSSDKGVTWSTRADTSISANYVYADWASCSIWEVCPGYIVGSSTILNAGYVAVWSGYGTVLVGTKTMFGDTNMSPAWCIANGGEILLLRYWYLTDETPLMQYIGGLPPTPESFATETNYVSVPGTNLGGSAIADGLTSDPAGIVAWNRWSQKISVIYQAPKFTRIRSSRHLDKVAFRRTKGAAYKNSESKWKRVIL